MPADPVAVTLPVIVSVWPATPLSMPPPTPPLVKVPPVTTIGRLLDPPVELTTRRSPKLENVVKPLAEVLPTLNDVPEPIGETTPEFAIDAI